MTTAQLQERLDKAIERKNKKFVTIERKEKQIDKKRKMLKDAGFDGDKIPQGQIDTNYDLWNKTWDIEYLIEDIERNKREIVELENLIAKYKDQIKNETCKETFYNELPEVLKNAEKELAERWYEKQIEFLDRVREFSKTHTGKETINKFGMTIYNWIRFGRTNEEVRKDTADSARYYVMDLYRRVKNITGDVIDVSGLTLNTDHALDGVVTGKLGKARVETIIAGGYNIQCEHYRALVKEIK